MSYAAVAGSSNANSAAVGVRGNFATARNEHPGRAVSATRVARRERDEQARFEGLVAPHRSGLRAYAAMLTRNADDADDLVQETLLRVYAHRESLRAGDAVGGYLRTTLKRLFINDYHRRKRRREAAGGPGAGDTLSLDNGDLPETADESGRTPESLTLGRMEADAVLRALHALPVHYRVPLTLCDQDGKTYEEIAELLSLPMGTVRSRISRARQRVQRAMANWRN